MPVAGICIFIIHHQLLKTGLTDSIIDSFFAFLFHHISFSFYSYIIWLKSFAIVILLIYPFRRIYSLISQVIFSSRYFSFSFPKCASAFSAYIYAYIYERTLAQAIHQLLLDVETLPWNPKDFVIFLYRDFHFAEFLLRFMLRYATYIIRRLVGPISY